MSLKTDNAKFPYQNWVHWDLLLHVQLGIQATMTEHNSNIQDKTHH